MGPNWSVQLVFQSAIEYRSRSHQGSGVQKGGSLSCRTHRQCQLPRLPGSLHEWDGHRSSPFQSLCAVLPDRSRAGIEKEAQWSS